MIYTFLFFGNSCDTFVCCWESSKSPSLTYNILNPGHLDQDSWNMVDNALFVVSRTISEEARNIFYSKGIFKVNSIQVTALLLLPQILDYLRELQVEDTLPNQRLWKLDQVLDRLSAVPGLKRVIVGANVVGKSWKDLNEIRDRPLQRLHGISRKLFREAMKSSMEELNNCVRRIKEAIEMETAYRQHRHDNEVLQPFHFLQNYKPEVHILELAEYPKVNFIHFKKRIKYEKSLDVYGIYSTVEYSSDPE
ncbi:hypothetical protein MMC17_003286 [Xylographa soralifera]|nr:hypothetical protein [Xylographa soralifera]